MQEVGAYCNTPSYIIPVLLYVISIPSSVIAHPFCHCEERSDKAISQTT
ncbi:unnamed protein product, partial [marine sediment metagenome]